MQKKVTQRRLTKVVSLDDTRKQRRPQRPQQQRRVYLMLILSVLLISIPVSIVSQTYFKRTESTAIVNDVSSSHAISTNQSTSPSINLSFTGGEMSGIIITNDDDAPNHNSTYPKYLVIMKSTRVGSTFVRRTWENEYNHSIFIHWEGSSLWAKRHFEACPKFIQEPTYKDGKRLHVHSSREWVCTAHLNDCFKDEDHQDICFNLIRDFNASVMVQMRANAIEKGISMSKKWGQLKPREGGGYGGQIGSPEPTSLSIAKDIEKYALRTLRFNRAFIHADSKGLIPLPTQSHVLWVWYEDLVRSCKEQFSKVFHQIGLDHLPLPQSCDDLQFRNEGPLNDTIVEVLSQHPDLVEMIDRYNFDVSVETDAYYAKFAKETEHISDLILLHENDYP